ncbi:MAG TPA: NAD(P)H-hydrate dehydratase, partial [Bacteroidia bacterium]|nr:NAD(P)H-hydrate dehydratase [Bacteroidia bacterium]
TAAVLIDKINSLSALRIAIDIPSGLFGDGHPEDQRAHIVQAHHTLTFQQPKLSFFFAENEKYVGRFHVLDIGLHPAFIADAETPFHFVTRAFVHPLLPSRPVFSHKGTFGHALLIAGSKGKTGAAVLCARACLRSGAGLVTVKTSAWGMNVLQEAVPEAMLEENEESDVVAGHIRPEKYSAIGMGPGTGTEKQTEGTLKMLIQDYAGPLVLDADALNIISGNRTILSFLRRETILTPHPGEFDRLTEKHSSGYERMKTQRELSVKRGIFIVLKGAFTSVSCPDGSVYFNSSGNPGMAKGGSGDALTGMITGLLARGMNERDACILGVYLHGLAGDIAASVHSREGMTAGDLIENIGGAWRMLSGE